MIFRKVKLVLEAVRRAGDPMNWGDRYGALYRAWGYVFGNQMRGDYYEFGVFDGRGLIRSFSAYKRHQRWLEAGARCRDAWRRGPAAQVTEYNARFYGLDTFHGMPANDEGNALFAPGFFDCSIETVRKRCAKNGLEGEQLCLLKGLFSETMPHLLGSSPRPAAIINIDCDLYASTKDALAASRQLIQDGTVLLFDDYNAFCASPEKGERRALYEFQKDTGIKIEPWFSYQFNAQAFLCHF